MTTKSFAHEDNLKPQMQMVVTPIDIRDQTHHLDEDDMRLKKQLPIGINFGKSDEHRHEAVLEKRSEPYGLYDIDRSKKDSKDLSEESDL